MANVKHYAANNQEASRFSINEEIDERTLREMYLPAFEASIKEGRSGSLMGAYNKVNGAFCCENDLLLNQILKKEWGFDGFVTSDFGAVHSTAPSVTNGLDLEMPNGKWLGNPLKAAVDAGQVPVSAIDEHLVRRFRTMMRFGVWDKLPDHKPIPAEANGAAARQLAEEAMVLLKNENNVLPLDAKKIKTIALIGPFAGSAMTGGGGSSRVDPVYTVTPLEGLTKRVGADVTVTLVPWPGRNAAASALPEAIAAAVKAAKTADVALVMVGDRQSEGGDHPIALRASQDELVSAVANANKKTVVILKSGGPLLMPWHDLVSAVVEAWYPGEEDGNAVAAILFGDVSPSGKLPITFPNDLADVPASTPAQYPGVGGVARYSEGNLVGYRWYDAKKIKPLYPFGYGLSYTSFAYRNLTLSNKNVSAAAPTVTVDFDIANTGKRAGSEVAQVYLSLPSLPGVSQPPQQLKGFARVAVEPGKTAHAHVTLDARAFSFWDVAAHNWKVAKGDYPVYIGASSRDIRLKGVVTVQ